MRVSRLALLTGAALIPGIVSQAWAAAPPAAPVEEVLITGALIQTILAPSTSGSRLNLPAIDTPASVATLEGEAIRLRGDETVNIAVTRAPGVTSTASVGNGGNAVAMRGFSGSSIAFLYDGVRNMAGLGNLGWPVDPWTIDRIEVLNGPSSVLFGTDAIGGSINIVPLYPMEEFAVRAQLSAASYNTYRMAADVTGPILDNVLYRIAGSRNHSEGWIHRGTSSSTALYGGVTVVLSDRLRATLSHDYGVVHPMNYNGLPFVNGVPVKEMRHDNYGTADVDVDFNENNTRFDIRFDATDEIYIRNVTSYIDADRIWKQGPGTLRYRPATNDVLRSGFGQFDQDQTQWNNFTEATWNHQFGMMANTMVVGADFEQLDFRRDNYSWPGATAPTALGNPVPGFYPTTGRVLGTSVNIHVNRYSLFGEDHLEITDRLSLVGGVRYDHQAVEREDLANPAAPIAERTYTPINWRIGAVFEVIPLLNVYAQYSKATDAITDICCISVAQLAFTPNRGQQYEAGVKQSLWDGRVEWTFAAYKIIKKDLLTPDPDNPGTLIQIGQQSSRGLEASVAVNVTEDLRVEVNGTVLDPQFDEFDQVVSGVLVSRAGNRPASTPWQSANVLVSWNFLEDWLALGSMRYVGERFTSTANTLKVQGYTVFDAGLRWNATETFAVDLRARNVFDNFYPVGTPGDGAGGINWRVGPPRAFEIALTARF